MSNMVKPIELPKGVEAAIKGNHISFKGPKGELDYQVPDVLELRYDAAKRSVSVARRSEERQARELHGLHRAMILNMVVGVTQGYQKSLEVHGTGYNVEVQKGKLILRVGYSHDAVLDIPKGVEVTVEQAAAQPDNPAKFTVKGIEKQVLGQFAADIKAVRPPEPYKGKGVRYAGEYVRRKEGKAFAGIE